MNTIKESTLRSAMMTDLFKIETSFKVYPAVFIAYDILYYKNKETFDMTLIERKKLLNFVVNENRYISISRIIDTNGIELFNLTKQQSLEGVVAKKKDSKYFFGKRSKDWIKFKHLVEDDYIICGYIAKNNGMTSIVIGQYNEENQLIYKGHVTLGSSIKKIMQYNPKIINNSPFPFTQPGNENTIWFKPQIVCIIQFMANDNNKLRQPVFKSVRNDKNIYDCKENKKGIY